MELDPTHTNGSLKGKTILLVNTGSARSTGDTHKKFIYKRLYELEVDIIAVNESANLKSKHVKHWVIADLADHEAVIDRVEQFMHDHPDVTVDGVITFYEDAVLLTAKLVDHFGLTGVSYEVADLIRNKHKFREFCRSYGLPTPRFSMIESPKDLSSVEENLTFPIVLKPIYGASSAFVLKVENRDDLHSAYEYIRNNVSKKLESALGDTTSILAEEYIDGDEVDINIIVQNGRIKFYSITDNYLTKEPFFIETGMAEPSALLPLEQQSLIDMADEVLEVLNVQCGCIQFEAKSTKSGPMPLEINLRMGGDEAYYFSKEAWGVDLIENAVKVAVNTHIKKVNKPSTPRKYLSGETLHAPSSGVISKIEVDGQAKTNKWLENIEIFKEVGDSILVPPFGFEYMGWVAVSGTNPVDADENLQRTLKMIQYDIVKFDEGSSVGRSIRKEKHHNAIFTGKRITGTEKIDKIRSIPLSEQRKLHIGIACNDYVNDQTANVIEKDLSDIGRNIERTLSELGYTVSYFDFNDPQRAIGMLNDSKVDLLFNVCERINSTSLLEPHAASIFDIMQIPYTGSNPFTLALCIDKIKVKKLLNYHNIPTPAWDYVYNLDDEIDPALQFPLIVKPANTDNSIGITNESVVTNRADLTGRVRYVVEELGSPALIEEYIDGDEYNVFIMGTEESGFKVLPLSRTIFSQLPPELWHIKTMDYKFGLDPIYKENIVLQIPPNNVSPKLVSLITEIALDTYNILDCHDYGRVEVKVDKNNNPYVLELNPNPSINVGDVMDLSIKDNKFTYGSFLENIISLTILRYRNKPPYYHLRSNVM